MKSLGFSRIQLNSKKIPLTAKFFEIDKVLLNEVSQQQGATRMNAQQLTALDDTDLVDEAMVLRLVGGSLTPIHRSTLWRGINTGRYPKPIKVSANCNRWRVGDMRKAIDHGETAA
ncbi:hypothetical protein NKH74_10740 [Mesorhizobium sp. M0933]|uniref:helix-turn-helix transcriptional regulator n=1 Tax=Mesorhizobium sp. M0933 TaxID=2957030 RepID=UPI00333AAF1D